MKIERDGGDKLTKMKITLIITFLILLAILIYSKKPATQPTNSTKSKKIILIGHAGSGKSTLANVLLNKDNNFEAVFSEVESSINKSTIQSAEAVINNTNYLLIDTAAISSNMSLSQLLTELKKSDYYLDRKLDKFLLVINGKFTHEKITIFNSLKVFSENISIILTNFAEFEDKKACQRNLTALKDESAELKEIISKTNIVLVDNPSLQGRSAKTNLEIRKRARVKLIESLKL